MFDKIIKKLAGCEDHFSKEQVTYIIAQILDETVDREMLRTVLRKELEPYVGAKLLDQVIESMNKIDRDDDLKRKSKWIKKLKDVKSREVVS